jgi:hypothetical protein
MRRWPDYQNLPKVEVTPNDRIANVGVLRESRPELLICWTAASDRRNVRRTWTTEDDRVLEVRLETPLRGREMLPPPSVAVKLRRAQAGTGQDGNVHPSAEAIAGRVRRARDPAWPP